MPGRESRTQASDDVADALVWHAIAEAALDLERPGYLQTGNESVDRQLRGEAATAFALERTRARHGKTGDDARIRRLDALEAERGLPGPETVLDVDEARVMLDDARSSGVTAVYARLEDGFSRAARGAKELGRTALADAIRRTTGCREGAPAPEPGQRPAPNGGARNGGRKRNGNEPHR